MEKSQLRTHQGRALFAMADFYHTLQEVIVEQVQNAIDANPERINIDLNLNSGELTVTDDGDGVTKSTFEKALRLVGISIKKDDRLGRFGRGMISPLGKCASFEFTSCPKRSGASHGYYRWTFVSECISEMQDGIEIPIAHLDRMRFSRKFHKGHKGVSFVPYRSMMVMKGIIADKRITRVKLDDLEQAIIDRYGVRILEKKINISISFTDSKGNSEDRELQIPEYNGRALPYVTYENEDSGDVNFRMFVAPAISGASKKGKVSFGEKRDDSRLTMLQFSRCVGSLLDSEVALALRSGVFEGEILCERIVTHPDRNRFEENDALMGLCICIGLWFEQVGKKHYQAVVDQNRESRFQRLGVRSMKVIKSYLDRDEFRDILELINLGNTGEGHFDVSKAGKDKRKALSIQGGTGKKKERDGEGGARNAPKKEKKGHVPSTVGGPEGKNRSLVRSGSTGIMLSVDDMPTKSCIYEMDLNRGVLSINSRHPYFAMAESTDTTLMRYFETVAALAFTLLRENPQSEFYESKRQVLESSLELLMVQIIDGDNLSERRKARS